MRVLIQIGHQAEQDYTALTNALSDIKVQTCVWNERAVPTFEIFESFKPDVFIGASSLVTRSIVKCVEQYKPKTALFLDKKELAFAPDLIFSNKIIDAEIVPEIPRLKVYPCVNLNVALNAAKDESFDAEIVYIGSYRTERELINRYILPLADDYKLRIYGYGAYPIPCALGIIEYSNIKHALYNSIIYIYLTKNEEDYTWNPLLSMMVGTRVVTNNASLLRDFSSDYITDIKDCDISELIQIEHPHMKEQRREKGQAWILGNCTNYHYANSILSNLGIDLDSKLSAALAERIK
jgi:hypothetical protein